MYYHFIANCEQQEPWNIQKADSESAYFFLQRPLNHPPNHTHLRHPPLQHQPPTSPPPTLKPSWNKAVNQCIYVVYVALTVNTIIKCVTKGGITIAKLLFAGT